VQRFPFFRSLRLENPVFDASLFRNIDLWLLTHDHLDHLDPDGARVIGNSSAVYCPEHQAKRIRQNHGIFASEVGWNQSARMTGNGWEVFVRAIPAFHGTNPLTAAFAGNVNGWLVRLRKEEKQLVVYVTGDTFFTGQVRSSLEGEKIDLVIANAGKAYPGTSILSRLPGPLTMGGRELSRMLDVLIPSLAVPVHFGTFSHYSETSPKLHTRVPVRILCPGETTEIPLSSVR
jgi:L-ascorbate metabolism protein UlaG (beta-lactamase superfamily)